MARSCLVHCHHCCSPWGCSAKCPLPCKFTLGFLAWYNGNYYHPPAHSESTGAATMDMNMLTELLTYSSHLIVTDNQSSSLSLPIGTLCHQQKIFPSGRNDSVRVDALRQSRQRHPGGGILRAWRQFNASRSISPSDRCFTVSSRSVGLLF